MASNDILPMAHALDERVGQVVDQMECLMNWMELIYGQVSYPDRRTFCYAEAVACAHATRFEVPTVLEVQRRQTTRHTYVVTYLVSGQSLRCQPPT